MSKADKILKEELDPKDPDPTPRGGKNGRNTETKDTGRKADSVVAPTPMGGAGCPLRLLEMAGFAGVVVATLTAAVVGRCRR